MNFNEKKEKLKKKKNIYKTPNDNKKKGFTEIIKNTFRKDKTEVEKERKMDKIDKDIENLDEILKITSYKILCESDEFKKEKLNSFQVNLEKFVQAQIQFNSKVYFQIIL